MLVTLPIPEASSIAFRPASATIAVVPFGKNAIAPN
jgi:hypothetical protein